MSKLVLLCLHGWGGSKESFTELRAALKDADLDILTPDLPGFGSEKEPGTPWSTDDYALWVKEWLKKNRRDPSSPLHLLGHSHGGRIAIKLAAQHELPIAHLYLCAAAGIRHPRHLRRIIGLTLSKIGAAAFSIPLLSKLAPFGKKLLYKLFRVHDYEKASPIMRQTLVAVSAEDLRPLLSKISIPTDIFWGEDDGMTPIADAKLMHAKIQKSHLHTYPGVRHRVHRERAANIADIILRTISTPLTSLGEGER